MNGLRERGFVDTEGRFTDAGRETMQRIEALTDELASPPYDTLSPAELDELIAELDRPAIHPTRRIDRRIARVPIVRLRLLVVTAEPP